MDDNLDLNHPDIDAAFGSDFDAEPTTDSSTATTESVSTASSRSEVEPQQERTDVNTLQPPVEPQAPTWNPDGPGDLRVALQQEREARRQYEQQIAEYQAYLEQMQQAEEAQAVDPLDPEAFQYLEQRIQQEVGAIREQMQQAYLDSSIERAASRYSDYDQVIAIFNDPDVQRTVNLESFKSAPDPAEAAYRFAKQLQGGMGPSPEQFEAVVQHRVQQALANLQPQASQAPRTLSNIPAAAPNDGGVDLKNLTQADFKKHGLNLLDLL